MRWRYLERPAFSLLFCSVLSAAPVQREEIRPVLKSLNVTLAVERRPTWPLPSLRTVEVLLIPQPGTPASQPVTVSLGLPFGPNWLADHRHIRVLDQEGSEVPAFTCPLVWWWLDGRRGTARSVLVQFEMVFPNGQARKISILWDKSRTYSRAAGVPVSETLATRHFESDSGGGARTRVCDFQCARILPVLPAKWLSESLVAWQQVPACENSVAAWYDRLLLAAFDKSVRHISARTHEPHLFDRIATYAKMYVRHGDPRFLEAALAAADFYLRHLTPQGYFDLKPGAADLKYSSNEGLAILYMLTGDPRFLAGLERVVKAWSHYGLDSTGRPELRYTPSTRFWTERHHAFGMLAALHGYEISGRPELLDRARAFFEAALEMQVRPADGKPPDGAWVHSAAAHGDGNGWTSSPWMSTFLLDAIWKYWMFTDDQRAPASLAMYAQFMAKHGVTPDGKMTFYMANSPGRGTSEGPCVEHNVEGIYILSLGHYLSMGRDPSFLSRIKTLVPPVMNDDSNVPARKFNWRFRSTPILVWLQAAVPGKR